MLNFRLSRSILLSAAISLAATLPSVTASAQEKAVSSEQPTATQESDLLSHTRRLTFEGRRAGEGYFNTDGTKMVFQSERDPANPFFQIYLSDLETGDIQRISPGYGKTTCAWIHPDGERVLFASTHQDERAKAKQKEEIAFRESGQQKRYTWDYDPNFELYVADLDETRDGTTEGLTRLTDARGYDAEGSFSPDGSQIVFASNREAYSRKMTEKEQARFDQDPAFMIDLYLMNADGSPLDDGSRVRRLTDEPGYDGGPFFSPDGKRICWRRFSPDGARAEIFTMNLDGSDVRRLTNLDVMSWAPFFHPSGDYLIFTTNLNGFANFELYLVRADGKGEPVRVTTTDGFDGLPVFLPDGNRLSWTSNRVLNADGSLAMEDGKPKRGNSQIFIADFDDAQARELLGLDLSGEVTENADAAAARENVQSTAPEYRPSDVVRHVDYLTRVELAGRMTGTEGERRATAYVAAYLESLGFVPAGEDDTFFQSFEFPAGSDLGDANQATLQIPDEEPQSLQLGEQWTPLSFSQTGEITPAEIVFAGYGLRIQGDDNHDQYDSYVHLDVLDKWVMVLRDVPQDISPETRQWMARYGDPRRKATIARDLGAKGILFVAGPTSKVNRQLIRFDATASQAEVSIASVSIDNDTATRIIAHSGEDLGKLQRSIDDGSLAMGFPVEGVTFGANIEVNRHTGTGRNVIARLPVDAKNPDEVTFPFVIVGAHVDHLGRGGGGNSLATEDEQGQIHFGADDNASGVAAMLEIAQAMAADQRSGKLSFKRDFLVAAWSGEELGLFGSQAFVEEFSQLFPEAQASEDSDEQGNGEQRDDEPGSNSSTPNEDSEEETAEQTIASAHGMSPDAPSLASEIGVYMNLDMVGRMDQKLIVQGIGSSPGFEGEVGRRNVPVGLPLQLDKASTGLPTDASAFVSRGVPILSAFTGAHEDYHTPRDTAEKLNYDAAAKIARLFGLLSRGFLTAEQTPVFELNEGKASREQPRVALRAYLGTIPDYAAGEVKGQRLSGVTAGAPAAEAGIRGGDVVVRVAGRLVEDINDYTYAIEALKIGEPVTIEVVRDGETLELEVTPGSRD